jgi:hypothetical protein
MTLAKTDIIDVIEEAIHARMVVTHTAIPAIVKEVKASTVTVQVAVKRLFDIGEEKLEARPYLMIPDVPVVFPSAGDFSLAFTIVVGDEGLLHFCEKDIQTFLQSGKLSTPTSLRKHALEDAVFVPTRLSDAKRVAIPADGIVMRAGANTITINASGISIQGDVNITGAVTTSGTIHSDADVTADTISLKNHVHTESGGNNTSPPNP